MTLPLDRFQTRGQELWQIAERLFSWASADYGTMCAKTEFFAQHRNPYPGDTFVGVRPDRHLPGVYYANLFGSELLSFLDKNRIETCPGARNEPLPNGGRLITTAPSPDAWGTPEAVELKEQVRRHLGEQIFFDVRSPDRVPVLPEWIFGKGRSVAPEELPAGVPVAREFFETQAEAEAFIENVLVRCTRLRERLDTPQLDHTPGSLSALERAASSHGTAPGADEKEFVLELAAYFGEVVRRSLDGDWVYDRESLLPATRLPDGRLEFPLIRAVKFHQDGDSFSDWYDFVAAGGERRLTQTGRSQGSHPDRRS